MATAGQREVTKVIIAGDVAATMVRNYQDKFYQIAPDASPTASLAMAGKGRTLAEDEIHCGERNELPRTFTLSEDIDGSETTFTVSDTTGGRPGRRFQVQSTLEICQVVTVDSSTQLEVIRGTAATMGYAVSSAALSGDTCKWLGTPQQEAADTTLPKPLMFGADDLTNYIEEFNEPLAFSWRKQAIIKNGGLRYAQTFGDYEAWQLELQKSQLNSGLLYNKKGDRDGAEGRQTQTGGIPEFAYWVDNAFGACTDRDNVEENLENVGRYSGGKDLYMACSPLAMRGFNQLYQGANPTNASGEIPTESGVRIRTIILPNIQVNLKLYSDPDMVDYVSNSVTYGQTRVWSPRNVKWDVLIPFGKYTVDKTGATQSKYFLYGAGGWRIINTRGLMVCRGITLS